MAAPVSERRKSLRNGDGWVTPSDLAFCELWFEFLLFSPSYELARKHRAGTLADGDRARLPADFDAVLAVYDDLGDVLRITFDDWWRERGIRLFGYQGEQPRVGVIDVLFRENPAQIETLLVRGAEYIKERWNEQGQPPSAIVSIPLGLTKAQMALHLEYALAPYKEQLSYLTQQPPKYGLHRKKRDLNSLLRYMKCLLIKATFPELKLYQVGVVAELSVTYSSRVDQEDAVEDRHALKILTSRAISRGLMIAENAARGIFPSYAKNEHAVAPDWNAMYEIIDSRNDWLESVNSTD